VDLGDPRLVQLHDALRNDTGAEVTRACARSDSSDALPSARKMTSWDGPLRAEAALERNPTAS